jgi:hypothetical protein
VVQALGAQALAVQALEVAGQALGAQALVVQALEVAGQDAKVDPADLVDLADLADLAVPADLDKHLIGRVAQISNRGSC